MRVLLIEDDRKAAKLLAKGLHEDGFVVDVAPTGETGEEQAFVNEYDVIVLDWLLPGKDGIAVCQAQRARDLTTPILMLTARHSLVNRVNGLSTDADDYLTKPFAFAELLARIRALLRRARIARPPILRVTDLLLDPASRKVTRGGVKIILAVIGLTGALLARKALNPIDQMVSRARRIGEANLADRLPHPGTADEIGRLVETLNEMLGRLERSFEVRRMFSADASHELRSPLSRLRAKLEVALRRPRPVAEYEETLRSCLHEVERVQGIIEDLLELARIDATDEQEPAEAVSVSDLVDAAVLAVRPRAEQQGVIVVADPLPDIFVNAAPVAAKVALANILDNAVKFSPAGGRVRIAATAVEDEAVIAVSDAGPGVSPDEAARLFQPFYRGKASRSTGAPGVGLGLAISRVLVQRQGGRISLDAPDDRGATFKVHLPRAGRFVEEDVESGNGRVARRG